MGANALGQKKLKKFSNKLNITFVKGSSWGHWNGNKYYRLFDENNKVYYIVLDKNNKYHFAESEKQYKNNKFSKALIYNEFSKALMSLFNGEDYTGDNSEIANVFKSLKDKVIEIIQFNDNNAKVN